jgi:ABC-2 type transport system permease protein
MLRLYFRLMGARLRSEMQYRVSLLAETFGAVVITALDFVAIAFLLLRFDAIGGWALAEVAFLYGASSVSLSLAELVAGGFDYFDRMVVRGEFDRLLLRPLGLIFQMLTEALAVRRIGRLAQGAAALGFALAHLRLAWGAGELLFFAAMLLGGALFFLAIMIAGATACFWSPQTAELTNIFTYGGQFMTSYPLSIYEQWVRSLFTFVLPLAFINYYPALFLLDKPDPFGLPAWTPFLAPVVAVGVFAGTVRLWRAGVRRYQSTGS